MWPSMDGGELCHVSRGLTQRPRARGLSCSPKQLCKSKSKHFTSLPSPLYPGRPSKGKFFVDKWLLPISFILDYSTM